MDERADDVRRSLVAWLRDVLRDGYREGGLAGMVARAPRFVAEDLLGERLRWWLLAGPVSAAAVDREELLARTGAVDRLWYAGEDAPFAVEPPPGATPSDLPGRLADAVGTYRPRRPFVCELHDARLVGPDALGFVDDRLVLETAGASEMYCYFALRDLYEDLAADRSHLAAYLAFRRVLAGETGLPTDPRTDDPHAAAGPGGDPHAAAGSGGDSLATAVAFVPYWRNYYHWTVEFLPKVRLLERYRAATGREPTVLLEPDPPGWLTGTLRLAGWDPASCVEWAGAPARVDRLVVPLHRNRYFTPRDGQFADDFNPAPGDVRWLADRMQSNVPDLDAGEFSPRVFLSRRDTATRPVANEDAVRETLEPLGFESYALGEMAVADQVRLFANAETVVAPHGAGLVNVIHATDATVVELFPEDKVEPYYFCLARQLGFDYHWSVYPTREEAMVVDTGDLRATVSRALDG